MHRSILCACVLLAGCGSDSPTGPGSIAGPVAIHDKLVPEGSAIVDGAPAMSRGQSNYIPFDDFVPTVAASIRTVIWQGFYCDAQSTAPTPGAVATGFRIKLAADDAGGERPPFDALHATETTATTTVFTLAAASVRQELEFTRATCPYYRVTAELPTPHAVRAGTRYWIGIQALLPEGSIVWSWRAGVQDNSFSILWFGVTTTFFVDRAFALRGTAG